MVAVGVQNSYPVLVLPLVLVLVLVLPFCYSLLQIHYLFIVLILVFSILCAIILDMQYRFNGLTVAAFTAYIL